MVSYEYSHSRDSSSRGVSRASYSAVFDNTQCEESLPFWQAKAAYSLFREYAAFNLVGCVFSSLGLRYPLRKPRVARVWKGLALAGVSVLRRWEIPRLRSG